MTIRHNANYKQLITGTVSFALSGDIYTGSITFDKWLGAEPNYINIPNYNLMTYDFRLHLFRDWNNFSMINFSVDFIYYTGTPEIVPIGAVKNYGINQIGGLITTSGIAITPVTFSNKTVMGIILQTDSAHSGWTYEYSGYVDCYATGQYI